ncbi:ABC transporter permease [Rhodothermus profundi]|uniref:ABC-type transport system, involved in lipoprotein release, permease component n=1 Tax=Rhodothermus profundi TaxID=633813 RepID=A0A1M6TKN9_9BACT|nr:FtsX-like permease family protein [Rhodothermus profundi]SHK57622.1 ABC-type transport system, involved in lipoprotein release, permease component [Rhodothermus profundi]
MTGRLAWRNLGRNRRRTLLTVAAVFFATFLMVLLRGLQLGTYDFFIRQSTRLSTGYLQIQHADYLDRQSLRQSFRLPDTLFVRIRTTPGITGAAPRLESGGLISNRATSYGVRLLGIDPTYEPEVTDFPARLIAGRMPAPNDHLEIVAGYRLLENLNASVGDTLVLLAETYQGFLTSRFAVVVGALRIGYEVHDRSLVLMPLQALQDLLETGNRVTAVAMAVRRNADVPVVRDRLQAWLSRPLVVRTWEELMPELRQAIELDNISGLLFLFMLLIVVAFGVLNTVLMSVLERSREFGMLLALGMPNERLLRVVFLEAVLVVLLGLILGSAAGFAVNAYLIRHPITLGGELAQLYEYYGFLPVLTSSVAPEIFARTALRVLTIAGLAILYPLWHVLRLEPLKGIRYT